MHRWSDEDSSSGVKYYKSAAVNNTLEQHSLTRINMIKFFLAISTTLSVVQYVYYSSLLLAQPIRINRILARRLYPPIPRSFHRIISRACRICVNDDRAVVGTLARCTPGYYRCSIIHQVNQSGTRRITLLAA